MHPIKIKQSFLEKLWHIYGQRLYRLIVSKDTNLFLKPTDTISYRPTLFGSHEPNVEALIRDSAGEFGDFLLDVGANVGLTSCLAGGEFGRIDCVEPNDLVANILETNVALNLPDVPVTVHRVGLGVEDAETVLHIPVDNFGAAFIEEGNTHFDADRAEGLKLEKDETNIVRRPAEIREAAGWLRGLFREYAREGMERGVVKIDVEGHDEVVFKAVLETLPKTFGVVVVMENWFDRFPVSSFKSKTHSLEWYSFRKRLRPLHSIPFKLLGLSSSYISELGPLDDDTVNPYDVVCAVRPTSG